MSELKYDALPNLRLTVMQDHAAIAKAAAHRIAEKLRENPKLVIGLATGATMEPVYAELVRMHKEEGLSFAQARFFNLDHYKGVPKEDRNSYDYQLHKLLLNNIDAKKKNIHLVQGSNFDPAAYEQKIQEAGGIDVQLLGIGGEGHIGFNEVGSKLKSRTREVKLSARTKIDNGIYFNREGEKVPDAAYTMGIGTILEAREIIALANNPNKAWAVRNMMEPTGKSSEELSSLEFVHQQLLHEEQRGKPMGKRQVERFFAAQEADTRQKAKPVEELPARALHAHKNVHFFVDEEAASMVRPTHLLQCSNLNASQVNKLVERFSPHELRLPNGQEILLTPGFDFYDPKEMRIDEQFNPNNAKHIRLLSKALAKATDVAVGAHQDDAEIMAGPMMLEAAKNPKKQWLTMIVTDGAASKSLLNECSQTLTPRQLTDMRQLEQRKAAQLAGVPVIQLKFPSASVGRHMGENKKREVDYAMGMLFKAMPNMERVFGHNPIDKHPTHIAVLSSQTAALRAAKPPKLQSVYGMEVWGGLTGLPESMLSMFVVEKKETLNEIKALIDVFKSQILGQGRDYSEGTIARIKAHGAYVSSPHRNNPPPGMVIGVDLTKFTRGRSMDMGQLAEDLLEQARAIKVRGAGEHAVGAAPKLSNGFAGMAVSGRSARREL